MILFSTMSSAKCCGWRSPATLIPRHPSSLPASALCTFSHVAVSLSTRVPSGPASNLWRSRIRLRKSQASHDQIRHYDVRTLTATFQTTKHAWDSGVPYRRDGLQESAQPRHVAIIGGGITGLSAAFELLRSDGDDECNPLLQDSSTNQMQDEARNPRPVKVTIYEAGPRLGGWLYGSKHKVPGRDNEVVMFESGPRTLRPEPKDEPQYTRNLIARLGLEEEVVTCPKSAPAARNRYVYYPDQLVRLPGPGTSLGQWIDFLRSPLGRELIPSVWREFRRLYQGRFEDISLGRFLYDRMGAGLADLASAGMHGVYAGDIDQLSMGAIAPRLQYLLWRYGSVVRGSLLSALELSRTDEKLVQLPEFNTIFKEVDYACTKTQVFDNISVFSFNQGIEQLADQLVAKLEADPRVTIKRNARIADIQVNTEQDSGVHVKTSNSEPAKYSQVLATISSNSLAPLITAPNAQAYNVDTIKSILQYNPSVTVMVVNLYFENSNLLPVQGFGYLIPRNIPLEQNPEMALGVVFESDAIQGQAAERIAGGTKLTVMLGGHWWNDFKPEMLPTKDQGIEMARSILRRHLDIKDEPLVAVANLQKDCIPQYQAGHRDRMVQLHDLLMGSGFDGRLMVGGGSYQGISVNDCIKNGTLIGQVLKQGILDSGLLAPTKVWCARTVHKKDLDIVRNHRLP